MPTSVDLDRIPDKAYESGDYAALLNAPVAAMAGVAEADGEALKQAFDIKPIGDLGRNKYPNAAHARVDLADAAE